jgi:signal peptide peptidase SppA
MTDYARIAGRLLNTPIAIRPEKAEMLTAVLAERLGIASLERMDGSAMTAVEMNAMAASGRSGSRARDRYYEVVDGIALLPIEGTLVHKSGWVGTYSGMMGYDFIATMLRQAMFDDEVRGIWLDVNSPGGEVFGCFDLADEIHACNARNGGKPIWGMVNEMACSAAYALISAADRIYSPRTGISGSIGVYMLYVEQTKHLSKEGIDVEFIRSGERKARGSGLEALDDATRAKLQADVDKARDLFARLVARNRRMSVKAVLDTEADWFAADDAKTAGLVDGVLSEIEALSKFQRHLKRAA